MHRTKRERKEKQQDRCFHLERPRPLTSFGPLRSWPIECTVGGAAAGGGAWGDEIDDLGAFPIDEVEHLGSTCRPLRPQVVPLVIFVDVPLEFLRGWRRLLVVIVVVVAPVGSYPFLAFGSFGGYGGEKNPFPRDVAQVYFLRKPRAPRSSGCSCSRRRKVPHGDGGGSSGADRRRVVFLYHPRCGYWPVDGSVLTTEFDDAPGDGVRGATLMKKC